MESNKLINLMDMEKRIKLHSKSQKRNKKFDSLNLNKDISGYYWGIPRRVLIPKDAGEGMREVFMYDSDDSFILKMINEIVAEKFDRSLSKNLYSYREGYSCLDAVKYVLNNSKGKYGVKLDITNYFLQVPLENIFILLEEIFKNRDELETMKRFFSDQRYIDIDGIEKERFLSLKPGNAFSAFLSNYALKDIDKQMSASVEVYSRYSDDILMYDSSKERLNSAINKLKQNLQALGLEIKDKKTEFFNPGDDLTYLGLKTDWKEIDISKKRFNKVKKMIKTECKKYRKEVELGNISKEEAVKQVINWYNKRIYRVPPVIKESYSWASSTFRNITTFSTLREIDFYFINTLRWVYTGKHNKANVYKLTTDRIKELGWVSLVEMFYTYHKDIDVFNDLACIVVSRGGLSIEGK